MKHFKVKCNLNGNGNSIRNFHNILSENNFGDFAKAFFYTTSIDVRKHATTLTAISSYSYFLYD